MRFQDFLSISKSITESQVPRTEFVLFSVHLEYVLRYVLVHWSFREGGITSRSITPESALSSFYIRVVSGSECILVSMFVGYSMISWLNLSTIFIRVLVRSEEKNEDGKKNEILVRSAEKMKIKKYKKVRKKKKKNIKSNSRLHFFFSPFLFPPFRTKSIFCYFWMLHCKYNFTA